MHLSVVRKRARAREAFTVPSLTRCVGTKGQNLSRQVSGTARKPGHRASLCSAKAERQPERESDEEHVGWLRLAPTLFVHVCGALWLSIALPILVFLVADFGGSAWVYGLLGATYSTAQSNGFADVVVGANTYPNPDGSSGRITVFHGGPDTTAYREAPGRVRQ